MPTDQYPPNSYEDAEAEKLRSLWSTTSGWTIPPVNKRPPLPADDLEWLKERTADMLQRQLEDAETTNNLLRGALDSVRRDLAELKAQVATTPAPAPEPAVAAQVTRKQVRTLEQPYTMPGEQCEADAEYAELLSAGWVKDYMVIRPDNQNPNAVLRYVVLVRETSEPAAGDATRATASTPEPATVTAVGPTIVIEPMHMPSLNGAFDIPIIHDVRAQGAEAVIEARNEDLYEAFRTAYARAPRAVRPAYLPAEVK